MKLPLGQVRSVSLVCLTALLAAACGGGSNGNPPPGGQQLAANQTLSFPIYDSFGTLDPAQLNAETDSEIAQNVFDNLVIFNKDLKVVPDLAQSMPTVSSDGLTYTFHLRHDVTFSNGDKFTSKDVLYSWNRAAALQGAYSANLSPIVGFSQVGDYITKGAGKSMSPAQIETMLENKDPHVTMPGLTASDDYTVVAKLTGPAGWWLSAIALESTTGAIVDVNAVKGDPANWWTNPATLIGTGPYKMTAYTPKQSVEFQAVPNWWGSPKPVIKTIHIDILQDPHSGVIAWEQGKYGLDGFGGYSNIPIDDVLRIKNSASEKSQLLLHPKVRSYWVSFNMFTDASRHAGGPFATNGPDPAGALNLRKAFDLAIDKSKIANIVCHNLLCTPADGGLIPPSLFGYLGKGQDPLAKFDATQAKQLLKSADPTGSKTANLTYAYDPENPINVTTAQNLQDQWQTNLGVHVNLLPVSHSQFIKARLGGAYIMSRDGWQADYNHPQDWYDNLWGKTPGCPDTNCTSGYDTSVYDSILAKADATVNIQQALPYYNQLAQMLIKDVVYIPLYYTVGAFLIKPWVKNGGTNAFFDNYWNTMAILKH
ncbi:MAG: peptide ABC transporter substrate-binding protein [Candidatus Dormibacteraceae bacterium]